MYQSQREFDQRDPIWQVRSFAHWAVAEEKRIEIIAITNTNCMYRQIRNERYGEVIDH
jgi:hypothetical protein